MPPRANRSDLVNQPANVPSGRRYGQRKQAEDAIAAVPIPNEQERFQRAVQSASAAQFEPVPIGAPTARPDEPLTSGMDIGAGAGSEMLSGMAGAGMAPTMSPVAQSAQAAVFALEQAIGNSEEVSYSTLQLLNELKKEAMMEEPDEANEYDLIGILDELIKLDDVVSGKKSADSLGPVPVEADAELPVEQPLPPPSEGPIPPTPDPTVDNTPQ